MIIHTSGPCWQSLESFVWHGLDKNINECACNVSGGVKPMV